VIEHVGHTNSAPSHFGAVSWTNTFPGRSDGALSELNLLQTIDTLMKIQYNMAAVTDEDASLCVDTKLLNSLDLLEERVDVHNTTASNEILASWAHNSRWQNVNIELLVVVDDGVPRVVAALGSAAELRLAAEDIHELTFAFITPLRT